MGNMPMIYSVRQLLSYSLFLCVCCIVFYFLFQSFCCFHCFPLIVDVFPSGLVCNLDLFSLNRFMTFEQRYTIVALI